MLTVTGQATQCVFEAQGTSMTGSSFTESMTKSLLECRVRVPVLQIGSAWQSHTKAEIIIAVYTIQRRQRHLDALIALII